MSELSEPMESESGGSPSAPAGFERFRDLALPDDIVRNLDEMGMVNPTPIQRQAIPVILDGKDVIGQSETGSGKTAAYLLPVFARLERPAAHVQALVLTPTRELCIQVTEVAYNLTRGTGLRVMAIFGGANIDMQMAALKQHVHLVVGTPGRVKDLMVRGRLDLSKVHVFILDEADEMMDMGFLNDITYIANRTARDRQNLLFSATVPPGVKRLIDEYMNHPEHVQIKSKTRTAETITHRAIRLSPRLKEPCIKKILLDMNPESALIFCNKKLAVPRLARFLNSRHLRVDCLHGGMEQEFRMRTMKDFRRGDVNVLVCTDVAARGLDIPSVDLVINYDLPPDPDLYIHRVGRTGRIGNEGLAISLVGSSEGWLQEKIERHIRVQMSPMSIELPQMPRDRDDGGRRRDRRGGSGHGRRPGGRDRSHRR